MKKTRYEVWLGWKNYLGEIYGKEVIAVFFSSARASRYLEEEKKFWGEEDSTDTIAVYGIDVK